MTKAKSIKGKFYPLQYDEWLKACQELTPAAKDILYLVRTLDPYSDGLDVSMAEIARQLSTEKKTVHRSTVSRAFKELDAKGFIDLELIKVYVTIKPLGVHCCEEAARCDNAPSVVTTQHCCDDAPPVVTTQPHIYIDRARALKTLNTNSDLITQERVEEKSEIQEPEINQEVSSTSILIASSSNHEQKSEELQIVSVGQSSAAVPLSPTTIYRPTKEDEALNFGRRLVPMKGTYASRSSDPWMVDGNNPNPMLVQWVINKKVADQKNLKEAYRSYTPSEVNVKKELRSDYASASDWWQMFLNSVHQQAEIHQIRLAAGIPITAEEHNEIASIAPYLDRPLTIAPAALEPVVANTFLPVAAPPIPVEVPNSGVNADAYKVFVAPPKPSEEESLRGRELFIQQTKQLKQQMSMPKSKFIDTPATAFAKNRAWLHSGDPVLRAEATSWVKANAEDLEIDYDELGNIIDFTEVTF